MIHLHCHSHYSVLDGLSKVTDIVERAVELKAPAVAISDHGSISCLPEFMKEAKAAGVKPIIGCEFYLMETLDEEKRKKAKRYHLSVWAKSWEGVESIMAQLSLANRQFYRRPVLTFKQTLDFKDCMIGTACAFGVLRIEGWREYVELLHKAYGDDLYLEIMPHEVIIDGEDIQKTVNTRALEMSQHGISLLTTNDSHYTRKEDAEAHNTLMAIQYGKKLDDHQGWPHVFYMRSVKEMRDAFNELGYMGVNDVRQGLLATMELANKVDIIKPHYEISLPEVYDNDDAYSRQVILDGWGEKIKRKVGTNWKAYHERLIYELGIIKKMGFMKYFLMVEDVIRWSREQGIMVGPARGSAAGSLVCYLMDITQVDPIKHGLFFERFLNPDRVEMPDIDVDFQDNRRHEVFEYVVKKYGRENVGQIGTFSYLTIKSAFRDVCRTFGIDNMRVNNLSRQIEDEESFDKVPELASFARHNTKLVDLAKRLSGTIRNTGVHACGCLISSKPLQDVTVMERRKDGVMVSSWDMRQCESFGLLKMDLLGLTTLSILEHTRQLIVRDYGVNIDFTTIPLDDQKTLDGFSRGECSCIFQFEGTQMQQLLRDLGASDFETITATTALYRPGPLNSGLTGRYVKIAQGREQEYYDHDLLEPILKETRSVLVYQEQIMRIFSELGGFTWAQSDMMRKIIGKKLGKDEFDKHRERFMMGCRRNGVQDHTAATLFEQMAEFAAYSFNKSHAVSYTLLSYWSMYLKVNYPAEFLTGVLTWVKSDDRMVEAINEAKRLGVPVARPDINLSTGHYELDNGHIIAPLGAVKGVGDKAVEALLKARGDGVLLSMDDLSEKLTEMKLKRTAHKGIIEKLERAGVFESLGSREPDDEQRRKNYSELLPMFNDIPILSFGREKVDAEVMAPLYKAIDDYAKVVKKKPLQPQTGSKPVIFAINMPVKGENALLSNKGTRLFAETLRGLGVTRKSIYYTSVIKEALPAPAKAPKGSVTFGMATVREELKLIKPKLVICFAALAIPMFIPDGKMSKLQGRTIYSKEFDCYVMFSYSPQYQYYQSEKAGSVFYTNMTKVRNMFEGVS